MSETTEPVSPFAQVPAPLAAALASRGFTELTPVQAAVLAAEPGRDLLVSARTGSGKTVAFGLRMGPAVLDPEGARGKARALVVCPTRELAMQVAKELQWLFGNAGLRVVACVGGMDPRRESMALGAGVDIVVGTPGRLCDHINRKNLRLDGLRFTVLDEADEMLDMGFRDELELILQACPKERQTLLFSATFPPLAVALAEQYTQQPVRLALSDAREPHGDIQWVAMLHAPREREAVVVNVLRHYDSRAALVFCHTRETVHRIHAILSERGFSAVVLSGDLGQAERSRALAAVRDGRARVLVATNVAARGLDLPTLDLVIHADLPNDVESFTHRSGRTGRAGRKGIAVVLVAASRRRAADRLFQAARVNPERLMPPKPDAIRTADEGRLTQSVLAGLAESGEEDVVLAEKLLAEHSPAALVASLVASYRMQLPTPEDLPETFALGRQAERPHQPQRAFNQDRVFQPRENRFEQRGDRFEQRGDGQGPRGRDDRLQREDRGPRDDRDFSRPRDDAPQDRGSWNDRDVVQRGAPERPEQRPAQEPQRQEPQRPPQDHRPQHFTPPQQDQRAAQRFPAQRLGPDRPDDRPRVGPRDDRPDDRPRFGPREDRPNDRPAPRFGPRDDRPPEERPAPRFGPRDDRPRPDDQGGMRPPTRARPPEGDAPRPRGRGAAMFRVNRGFQHNAEPFWLVPLFCRRGRVDRDVIGRIDIRERETWFEIDPAAAEAFAESVARPDKKEPGVRFDRVD